MTLQEDAEKLQEAWRDLLYKVVKTIGLIAFVKRIRGLRLRDWIQEREKGVLHDHDSC